MATENTEQVVTQGAGAGAGAADGQTVEAEPEIEASDQSDQSARVRAYPVAPGVRLNVRSGPGTHYRIVRVLPEGATVPIYCQRPGDSVTGPYGTSTIWDCIANAQYVSDAYVRTGSDGYVAPRCS
ncbi:SH3 domain-containing protein [Streptomyces sp. NPDC048290]|uniref:SH3 domain-containing protein n=1 Tax=Streptomyces sp. NPDC048290 TaxID=3155811 RepID=UPI003449371B